MVQRKSGADKAVVAAPGGVIDLQFAECLSDIVSRFDPQHRHTFVNSAVELFTGRPRSDFLGKTNRELGMPVELVDYWDNKLDEVFRTGRSTEIQFAFDGPNGVRNFRTQITPETDSSGQVRSVLTFAREMPAAGMPFEMAMEHFRAIVDSSDDAIIGKDLRGFVTSWNRGAQAIFGYTEAEMIGRSLLTLFPAERIDEEALILERIILGEKVDHFETVRLHKSGTPVHVSVTISPICDGQGQVIGASKIARNITPLKIEQERVQMALDASCNGLWDWDLRSGAVYRSPQYYTVCECEPQDDAPSDYPFFASTVYPDDLPMVIQAIDDFRQGRSERIECEYRLVFRSAQPHKWMLLKGQAVERDRAGAPLRMVGTLSDISARKQQEMELREAATVFLNSYEGVMVVDLNLRIAKVNPSFTRITGYAPEEVIGRRPSMLSSGKHSKQFYRGMWASVEQNNFWMGEIWNRRKTGEVYTELLSIAKVYDSAGAASHYIGMFSDISYLKAHEAELDRAAHYDPLTGAPNRRLLADRLEQSIARTNRGGDLLAVCYLDLDGFKAVNDRLGHNAGDRLLVGVTESLRHVLRPADTLARLGGDEFVLLLSEVESPEECSLILERVLSSVSRPFDVDGQSVVVSASIGVSLYPHDRVDADTLLRHADQAMYRAKELGKNRFHLFDPASDLKAQLHRQFVERLGVALVNHEFCLFYQPKVDLQDGRIVGLEALIRWQHPERGLLGPGEFLAYFYGSSLECPLGAWVFDTALAQAQVWQVQGVGVPISINISANHLLSANFLRDVRDALARHPGVAPASIELEILESTAIDDMASAITVLEECKRLGLMLALDDFGTGYSSLTYLCKLPVDMLKIDQSFVRDMLSDSEDLGIVEGVIRLAGAFKREVIAEGVETPEHGVALLGLGCRLAQGFCIAKPMPPDQFPTWSATWGAQGGMQRTL